MIVDLIIDRLPSDLKMTIELRHCNIADREYKEDKRWLAHVGCYLYTICYAKALLFQPYAIQRGILAHEVGHLLQYQGKAISRYGYSGFSGEIGADSLIKKYTGIDIIYKNGIQHADFDNKEALFEKCNEYLSSKEYWRKREKEYWRK